MVPTDAVAATTAVPRSTTRRAVPGRARRPRSARRPTDQPGRLATLAAWRGTEFIAVALLVLLAAAVRWPYLMRLPKFTDETVEVRWVFQIVAGERFPLTAFDPYYGPIHAYILAACFKLFGYHMVLPRLVSLIFGALTVGATYLLGREMAGRWAGTLGAALLLTAPQHIVVNSHVAWENCTTPFYTTLCCWAFVKYSQGARDNEKGAGSGQWWVLAGWVALCGVLFGLAVQTHPGTIVLGPGLALAFVWHAWRSLRRAAGPPAAPTSVIQTLTRYSYHAAIATIAALLAYSPVLVYNLANQLAAVGKVASSRNYAFETNPSWPNYLRNLRELSYALARLISNPFRIPDSFQGYLTSPYLLLMVGLCLAGTVLLARRGQPLVFCVLVGTLAMMPRFNRAYGGADADQIGDRYLLTARYFTYILPLADIAIAVAVLTVLTIGWRALPRRWRDPAVAFPLVLLPLLVLYPLQPLARYYAHEGALDPNSASFLQTVEVIDATRGPRTPVWIDRQFEKVLLNDGSHALDVLDYLLFLDRVPYTIVNDPEAELRRVVPILDPADREAHPIVIMSRDRCWPMRGQIPMERISDTLLLNELFRYYAVYRWTPAPAIGDCQPPPPPPPPPAR